MANSRILLAAISLFLSTTGPSFSSQANVRETGVSEKLSALLIKIEKEMSSLDGIQSEFVQMKKLAAFNFPIKLEGRIYMERPGKLIWHVDKPMKYSVLITDKVVRQWDEETDDVRETTISGNPMLSAALDQMMIWFSGKYISLLKDYDVDLLHEKPVSMVFRPKETGAIKKYIESVEIEFQEDEKYLKKIVIKEISGDSSTITFINTILKPPADKRVFKVRGRVR